MHSISTVDSLSERLDLLQGTMEVLILRSLLLGPNHAYGLLQRKWIASQWKTSPNSRRARYYRLTPAGRKQLAAATSKWQRFAQAMARILAPEG